MKEFASESELCDVLAAAARELGFKVYAESAGFDMLMIAGDAVTAKGFKPGDQIGVEAKLRCNVKVLQQALPRDFGRGPDFYAVLVPLKDQEFVQVAHRLHITVLSGAGIKEKWRGDPFHRVRWFRVTQGQRCEVPMLEIVDAKAGTKSPIRGMTPWKVAAIKLCILAAEQGYLTRADFKAAKIDMTRWVNKRWIVPYDFIKQGKRKVKRYILEESTRPPHVLYRDAIDALGKAGLL